MGSLQVLGGGRMGEALLGGLLAAGAARPADVVVVERMAARRDELQGRFPECVIVDVPRPSPDAIVAVKPDDVVSACSSLRDTGVRRLLSVAAGVPTAAMEAVLPDGVAVVRAMPNTPALVGQGAAAVAPGASAGDDDLAWAEQILGAVGEVVRVTEPQLDAVTGLSGSGPAYLFLVAESLVDAGVLVGLPRTVAERLAYQTILGAATMLTETDDDPATLRAAVTSPGGTTAAGLRMLEDHGVRAAILAAVEAATARSRQLGS